MAIRRLRDETCFPMRLVVNPTSGDDDATLVQELVTVNGVTGVEQVTATVATLQGAFNLVPKTIKHPIFIELPLATLSAGTEGPVTLGPEAVLSGRNIDLSAAVDLAPPALTFDAVPGVYFRGQPTVSVATAAVSAATASSVTAFAGLTVDAHRGMIVEVVAGLGIGQKRRIIRNDATTAQLQAAWTTTPDVTSTVRITTPGSIIDGAVIVGEMLGARGSPSVSFDANCKILANAAAGTGNALMVRGAAVCFSGDIEGLAEGSASLAILQEESSFLFTDYTDLRNDPTGANLLPAGMFLTNGTWRVSDHSGVEGTVGGVVSTSARIQSQGQSNLEMRVDIEGNRPILGTRTPGPGIDLDRGSAGIFTPAVGTGFLIAGFTICGVRAQRESQMSVIGCEIADNVSGVILAAASFGNVNATTTAGTINDSFGAEIRGNSTCLMSQATTTLTGTTGNVELGNKVSGATHAWSDAGAGDSLMDGGGIVIAAPGIAEWGVMMDRGVV